LIEQVEPTVGESLNAVVCHGGLLRESGFPCRSGAA
jgi:hypothetical protein